MSDRSCILVVIALALCASSVSAQNSQVTFQEILIEREADPGVYITLSPPSTTITPFTVIWPATAPSQSGQSLVATGTGSGPFQFAWNTAGAPTLELVSTTTGAIRRSASITVGGIVGTPGYYSNDFQGARANTSQTASGQYALIGGGRNNTASGDYSVVIGGLDNTASGQFSLIGGGDGNIASGMYSGILCGHDIQNAGDYSSIGGGHGHRLSATADYSFIGGGLDHTMSGAYSFIGGGDDNQVSGDYSMIGGGTTNIASDTATVVGGGADNRAQARYATVMGGYSNRATGAYAVVGGGTINRTAAEYSAIPGGRNMTLTSTATGSFGFNAGSSALSVDVPNVFVVANADLWIANNDNSPRELRFYESYNTEGTFPGASTNYIAFKAPSSTSGGLNNTYTLPDQIGTAGQVLQIASGATTTAATLTWATPMTISVATIDVTADNQSIAAADMNGRTYLRLSSNGTPGNRTLTLPNGATDGWRVVIRSVAGTAGNGIEIAESTNVELNGTATLEDGDTLTLVWDESNAKWVELFRSNN